MTQVITVKRGAMWRMTADVTMRRRACKLCCDREPSNVSVLAPVLPPARAARYSVVTKGEL